MKWEKLRLATVRELKKARGSGAVQEERRLVLKSVLAAMQVLDADPSIGGDLALPEPKEVW